MISYELAKKLKEAGYGVGGSVSCMCYHWYDKKGNYHSGASRDFPVVGFIHTPTLEELIMDCGYGLVLSSDEDKCIAAKDGTISEGSTLEEAVANLWIALNKPKGI